MPISFNTKLKDALAPHHYIDFDNSNAYDGLSAQKQHLLLVDLVDSIDNTTSSPTAKNTTSTVEKTSDKQLNASSNPMILTEEEAIKEIATEDTSVSRIKNALSIKKNAGPSVTSSVLKLVKRKHTADYVKDIEELLSEQSYTQIALLSSDQQQLDAWKIVLKNRWAHDLQLDGHVFTAKYGDTEELKKLAKELNSPHITILPLKNQDDKPEEWAAGFATVNAVYATTPSRPYQNISINGLTTSKTNDGFSLKERNALLGAGISTWRTNGSEIIIDRLVTTYTTNETSADDPSYRDLNTLQTLSFLRYDFRTAVALRYPRHMLAKDDYPYKGPVITPKIARMFVISRYRQWQENNLVQDPGGLFAKNLSVEASDTPGKLDFYLPIHVMGQWRITQTSIAFKI